MRQKLYFCPLPFPKISDSPAVPGVYLSSDEEIGEKNMLNEQLKSRAFHRLWGRWVGRMVPVDLSGRQVALPFGHHLGPFKGGCANSHIYMCVYIYITKNMSPPLFHWERFTLSRPAKLTGSPDLPFFFSYDVDPMR